MSATPVGLFQPPPRVVGGGEHGAVSVVVGTPPSPARRIPSPDVRRLHNSSNNGTGGGPYGADRHAPTPPPSADAPVHHSPATPRSAATPAPYHQHSFITSPNTSNVATSSAAAVAISAARARRAAETQRVSLDELMLLEERERVRIGVDEAVGLNAIIALLREAAERERRQRAIRDAQAAAAARAAERTRLSKAAAEAEERQRAAAAKQAALEESSTTTAQNRSRGDSRRAMSPSSGWAAYRAVEQRQGTRTPSLHGPAGHSVVIAEAEERRNIDTAAETPLISPARRRLVDGAGSPSVSSAVKMATSYEHAADDRALLSPARWQEHRLSSAEILHLVASERHRVRTETAAAAAADGADGSQSDDDAGNEVPKTASEEEDDEEELLLQQRRQDDFTMVSSALLLDRWTSVAASIQQAHATLLSNVARDIAALFHHDVAVRDEAVRRLLFVNRQLVGGAIPAARERRLAPRGIFLVSPPSCRTPGDGVVQRLPLRRKAGRYETGR